MRFSTALATVAAVAPIVSAHDGPGIPKISGLNMRDLKARNLMDSIKARAAELTQDAHAHEKRGDLKPRQGGTDGKCGAGFGSCDAGYCCSSAGCKSTFILDYNIGLGADIRQGAVTRATTATLLVASTNTVLDVTRTKPLLEPTHPLSTDDNSAMSQPAEKVSTSARFPVLWR